MHFRYGFRPLRRPLLLLLEMCCLTAFAAVLSFGGPPGESLIMYWLILLSSVGMGIQGVAARHIRSPGINRIVFTSTLISIVMAPPTC